MNKFVVLIAAIPLLASCGTSRVAPGREPLSSEDATKIEALATSLFVSVTGDAVERESARYLQFKVINEPFVRCMRADGYDVSPDFLPIWTAYMPNATSGAWMGMLGRRPSLAARQTAVSTRGGADTQSISKHRTEKSQSYRDAAEKCNLKSVSLDFGKSSFVPQGSEELTGEFKKLIFDIDDRLGPIDDYDQCMKGAGVEIREGAGSAQGWQALYNSLIAKMPPPPLPNETPSSEWEQYMSMESAALVSDSKCRGEKYNEGLSLLGPELARFASDNTERISSLENEWRSVVEQARAQGFEE